jgi:hypothetical protein
MGRSWMGRSWMGRPRLRRPGRAVTVVAVAIAVLVATALTLGDGMLGGHDAGAAAPPVTSSVKATPTTVSRTSQTPATQGGHASPTAPPPSRTPAAVTRTTPASSSQPASPAAATTPAAGSTTPAAPPATPAASQSSAASPPPASSAGPLSVKNATLHSCADHPIAGATQTSASFQWVNNTGNTVYVYYTESSVYAGLTGSIPPDSSIGSTLAVGGTYLVDGPIGTCLGAITIDATTGEVTIS